MNVNKKRRQLLTFLLNEETQSANNQAMDKYIGKTANETELILGELLHNDEVRFYFSETDVDEKGKFIPLGAEITIHGSRALANGKYNSDIWSKPTAIISLVCTVIATSLGVIQFNTHDTEIEQLKKDIEILKSK